MTEASDETYAAWSATDKASIEKAMLNAIGATPMHCNTLFGKLGLGHATGSSRLQAIKDMGLIEVQKKVKGHSPSGHVVSLSVFQLSARGEALMALNPKARSVLFRFLQDTLRAHEKERAIMLKSIRAAYLAGLDADIAKTCKLFKVP